MKCPICKLENPNDAMICDCGYNFFTQSGGSAKEQDKLILFPMITTIVSFFIVVCLACIFKGMGVFIYFTYLFRGLAGEFLLIAITIIISLIMLLLNMISWGIYYIKSKKE
jgi:hypothetical protein